MHDVDAVPAALGVVDNGIQGRAKAACFGMDAIQGIAYRRAANSDADRAGAGMMDFNTIRSAACPHRVDGRARARGYACVNARARFAVRCSSSVDQNSAGAGMVDCYTADLPL